MDDSHKEKRASFEQDDVISSNFIKVGVPTQAMEKGGTETRLILMIVSLLFVLLSPFAVLVYSIYTGFSSSENYMQGCVAILCLVTLVLPLYLVSRYTYGPACAVFMTLRQFALPVLFPYSITSDAYFQHIGLGISILVAVGLSLLQRACSSRRNLLDTDKLRVMIIADALPPKVDGVATFAENSVRYLKQRGHTVHLITSIKGEDDLFGCPITRLPGFSTPISPGHSVTLPTPYVLQLIMDFKPDVIHLFEVSPLNLAMFAFAHVLDIPLTFSHHTRLDLYINIVTPLLPTWLNSLILFTLERIFHPLPDGHMCVSRALFEKIKKRGANIVKFWNSGVDKEFDRSKFSPDRRQALQASTTSVLEEDVPLVIHVGRLGPEKNSDEIPHIMRETYERMHGKVRFAVVGEGILQEQIKEDLDKWQIPCKFVGFQRGLALQECYASADVFFSPSTTEGFPLVFLEAMASGLAVVGPIAGGVPDIFTHDKEGCLYEAHNAKQAGEMIQRCIEHGGAEMRALAYAKGKRLSWSSCVTELEDLLKEVVLKRDNSGWHKWWKRGHHKST